VVRDPNGAAVAAVLSELFPATFDGLVPVFDHDKTEQLCYVCEFLDDMHFML
jgi:hypothetical protein